MKIWTRGSSPRSGSGNAWMQIKNVDGAGRLSNVWNFFRRDPNKFLFRLVIMDETWLYHYDLETKQQSMEWRHSSSPRPESSSANFCWKSSVLDFFGIKLASFSLIIFQRAKLSTPSITHLCWCNWRTFWRKNAAGGSPKGSCSCMIMPRLTGYLQPRRNWPTWTSSVLLTHHILQMWPRRTNTCSLDWKNSWKVTIFCPT